MNDDSVDARKRNACAACKYQRKRCNSDCPLAPFFPAHQDQDFHNAHRLFGVANILKAIRTRESPEEITATVLSMKWEANMRANSPVHGSAGVVWELKRKIESCELELRGLLHRLVDCRPQHQHQNVDHSFSWPLNLDAEGSSFLYENHQIEKLPDDSIQSDGGGLKKEVTYSLFSHQ